MASEIEHRNQLVRESAGVPLSARPSSAVARSSPSVARTTGGGGLRSAPTRRPLSAAPSSTQQGQNPSRPALTDGYSQSMVRDASSSRRKIEEKPQGQPEFAKGAGPRRAVGRPSSAHTAGGSDRRSSHHQHVHVTNRPSGEHWRAFNSEPMAQGALLNSGSGPKESASQWIPPQKMGIEATFMGKLQNLQR